MRVLRVEESGPGVVRPYVAETCARSEAVAAAPTPIEPGAIEVRAVINLIVEIKQ